MRDDRVHGTRAVGAAATPLPPLSRPSRSDGGRKVSADRRNDVSGADRRDPIRRSAHGARRLRARPRRGARPPRGGFARRPGDVRALHRPHRLADGRHARAAWRAARIRSGGRDRGRPRRRSPCGLHRRALGGRARGPDPQVREPPERGTRGATRSTRRSSGSASIPAPSLRSSRRRGSSHSSSRWRRPSPRLAAHCSSSPSP